MMLQRICRRNMTTSINKTGIKYLIVDGYSPEGREELKAGGASEAGHLYRRMLMACHDKGSSVQCDIIYPSDPTFNAAHVSLDEYDAVAWTGCSLCINDKDDIRVKTQVNLAQQVYGRGLPQFGSCWAAQIAVVAAGGRCGKNPRGREMGVGRKMMLTPEGRSHPMFTGRSTVFDAYESHYDEVTHMPTGGLVLAGNAFTRVQAVSVNYLKGSFWAVQYHPEYDLKEMASLINCRIPRLVDAGILKDRKGGEEVVSDLMTLFQNPTSNSDLRWKYGIDDDVLDERVRYNEAKNWVEYLVKPFIISKRFIY